MTTYVRIESDVIVTIYGNDEPEHSDWVTVEDDDPRLDDFNAWSVLLGRALWELKESDITMVRDFVESTPSDILVSKPAWVEYRKELRKVINRTRLTMPAKPDYPAED